MKKIKIGIIGVLLALAVLYGVGMVYEARAEAADRERYSPLGRMVNVNDRTQHIHCIGERAPGQPVIILEAGLRDHLYSWYSLQTEVSGFARVCAYKHSSDKCTGTRFLCSGGALLRRINSQDVCRALPGVCCWFDSGGQRQC